MVGGMYTLHRGYAMPIITVTILTHKVRVFVDSGATVTVLSVDEAHRPGIDWQRGRRQHVSTSCWTSDRGRASWRCEPYLRTMSPANLLRSMQVGGRPVVFLSQPSRGVRSAHSIRRQISKANDITIPSASIRVGFLRKRRLTISGFFKKPSCCSVPCYSL